MRIAIVGAGLAGLACAVTLQARGHAVSLFEGSGRVGGRIGSVRRPDGYVIDRGFQVLFTRYPAVRRLVDLPALDLRTFPKGALIRRDGRLHELSLPFDRPLDSWRSLVAPYVTLQDIGVFAHLTWDVASTPESQLLGGPSLGSTDAYLRGLGLSEGAFEGFLRPFFAGVLLDPQLASDARLFRFYWKMMALGRVAVPQAGMQALPDQLAARLAPGSVRLDSPVRALTRQGGAVSGVELASGEAQAADAVVLATSYPELRRLGAALPAFTGKATTSYFFAADRPATAAPLMVLNGSREGLVNQVFPLTNVNPAYAPAGRALHVAQVLGPPALPAAAMEAAVREELAAWFPGADVAAWQLVEAVETPFGQFGEEPAVMAALPATRLERGLYLASELTAQSSIDGALSGGERAALDLLADVGAPAATASR